MTLQKYSILCCIRVINKNKSVALQPRKAKTDWSGCCQIAVQGGLWLAKRLSLTLNFSFLNRISLLLIWSTYPIVLTRLGGPVPDPILPEKFLGYTRESNSGPLGWQSDMLTTIPNRQNAFEYSIFLKFTSWFYNDFYFLSQVFIIP